MYNNNDNQINANMAIAPTPTMTNHKKTLFVIAIILLIAISLTAAVTVVILNNNNNQPKEESISLLRENTPMLELYGSLTQEEMPLSHLQDIVMKSGVNANIEIENGSGVIKIPNFEDTILFYIDHADNDELQENADYDYSVVETIDSYQPTDVTYYYRYSRKINNEEAVGISFDNEEGTYEVYDGYESYQVPTKSEAIEAYLSPTYE